MQRLAVSAVQCMDAEIERIATAMKIASLWDNTLFVFAADNGGPPCKPQRSARSLFALCSWRFAQEVSRTLVAELLALSSRRGQLELSYARRQVDHLARRPTLKCS